MNSVLKRNIGWNLTGNLVYGLCQWCMLLVTARLGTQSDVGKIALALAVCSPIYILSNMGLRTQLATDVNFQFPVGLYIRLRNISSCVAMVIICILLLALRPSISTVSVTLAMAAYKWSESISDITYGSFQLTNRMRLITDSLVLRGLGCLCAYTLALLISGSVPISVFSFAAVGIAVVALNDLKRLASTGLASVGSGGTSLESMRNTTGPLLRSSIPLGIAAAAASFEVAAPRLIVGRVMGEQLVGVLALVTSFSVITSLFMSAMSQAVLPHFARLLNQSEDRAAVTLLVQMSGLLATIGLLMVCIAHYLGPSALSFMFGADYKSFGSTLTIITLSIAVGLQGWILNSYLFARGAGRPVAMANLSSLLLVIAGCWILVHPFGLPGVAWAVLVGAVAQVVLKVLVVRKSLLKDSARPDRFTMRRTRIIMKNLSARGSGSTS